MCVKKDCFNYSAFKQDIKGNSYGISDVLKKIS